MKSDILWLQLSVLCHKSFKFNSRGSSWRASDKCLGLSQPQYYLLYKVVPARSHGNPVSHLAKCWKRYSSSKHLLSAHGQPGCVPECSQEALMSQRLASVRRTFLAGWAGLPQGSGRTRPSTRATSD